jgi:hypothetical protein
MSSKPLNNNRIFVKIIFTVVTKIDDNGGTGWRWAKQANSLHESLSTGISVAEDPNSHCGTILSRSYQVR